MELSNRDMEILKLVGNFSQLASSQIKRIIFKDRSHAVPDRVLKRLVERKYLSIVGRRASGDQGGAGAFVYQLGRFGRALFGIQSRASAVVSNHALMIADSYVALVDAHEAGDLVLARWDTELQVPPVRADLFVRVDYPAQQRSSAYFLEIDLGTEGRLRIAEKLAGYWQAANTSSEDYFPYVVFVVNQLARAKELERIIRGLPSEQQQMVKVVQLGELIPELLKL